MALIEINKTSEPSEERRAEVLDHRIATLNEKIDCFQKFDISFKKTARLVALRDGFVSARAEINL